MTIKLVGTAAGVPTEFDGKYVKHYDPAVMPADGSPYDGGILEVTDDPSQAKQFETAEAAFLYWRQSFGIRNDGDLERPLTAWSVEIA